MQTNRTMCVAFAVVMCAASLAFAQLFTTGRLSQNPNGTPQLFNVARDGSVAVGTDGIYAIVYSPERGLEHLGIGTAHDASAGGAVIVGFDNISAWRWTASTGRVNITGMKEAYAVSADGLVVAGTSTASRPAIWTAASGLQLLPALSSDGRGLIWDLSADGSVAVGHNYSRAVRWVNGVAEVFAEPRPAPYADIFTEARGVSAEGSLAVGLVNYEYNGPIHNSRAVRFTLNDSTTAFVPEDIYGMSLRGIANDGVALGTAYAVNPQPQQAAVLLPGGMSMLLSEYAMGKMGMSLANFIPTTGRSISDDGRVMVGAGWVSGTQALQGYFLRLPPTPPCIGISFATQPVSMTSPPGTTAAFHAGVNGEGALTFQWRKDGQELVDSANVRGTSTPVLVVDSVTPENSGDYDVLVGGPCGFATSSAATLTVAASARTIYVRTGFTGDGASWESAFGSVEAALAVAVSGNEIWIASGTYSTTGATGFNVPGGVVLRGGFGGYESSPQERSDETLPTILHAQNRGRVIYASAVATLDRVQITGGYAGGSNYIDLQAPMPDSGAGVHARGTTHLIDCTLSGNRGAMGPSGPALYVAPGASVIVVRGAISNNTNGVVVLGDRVLNNGGAICVASGSLAMMGTEIRNNFTQSLGPGCTGGACYGTNGGRGGAIYIHAGLLSLNDCTFADNRAGSGSGAYNGNGRGGVGGRGGAIWSVRSTVRINSSRFIANRAGDGGRSASRNCGASAGDPGGDAGAIFFESIDRARSLTVVNSIFAANKCGSGGRGAAECAGYPGGYLGVSGGAGGSFGAIAYDGALYQPLLMSSVFSGNEAGKGGPSVQMPAPGLPGAHAAVGPWDGGLVVNCIFENNLAWDSMSEDRYVDANPIGAGLTVRSCILQSDVPSAVESFVAVPGFVSVLGADGLAGTLDDDFRLRADSPAIDRADNTAIPAGIVRDIAGRPRFVDIPEMIDGGIGGAPLADIGPYEAQVGEACPADINGDGLLDSLDVAIFFELWDVADFAPGRSGDLDLDGDADSDDIIYFFQRFENEC